MPEKFVYNEDFTSEGRSPPEPALSKVEWAGMTKKAFVSEHPLEGCTRTSPEPALSKVEWAGMTMEGPG
ncbi:MAG: hypothetical protein II819_03715 [Fibrobacter sp.]|nr:hypothetical protein [Fibrobacter sp.]